MGVRFIGVLFSFVCGTLSLFAQPAFRVMSYNVENLFDCRHDTLKEDTEFLPESERKWTPYRYWRKLNTLAKVIAAAGEERIPDVIGLCEVENDSVLFDLTRRSSLRALGYRYVMTDSPDVRGIDVALLYQPGHFRLVSSREILVPSAGNGFRPTRNLLYVKGLVMSGDTLHVVMCHFPSRLGRNKVSGKHRMLVARTLRSLVDSVASSVTHPNILVMGDFNAGCKDEAMRVLGVRQSGEAETGEEESKVFREPSGTECGKSPVKASYRYQGIWEDIDHIFVNGPLFNASNCFHTRDGLRSVFALPFMYELEEKYGGCRPFRTYQGPIYKGGVSDHFPVLLDFVMCEE